MAGLGNVDTIQLMSEPDAAAAWTLLRDINPNNLKVRYHKYPSFTMFVCVDTARLMILSLSLIVVVVPWYGFLVPFSATKPFSWYLGSYIIRSPQARTVYREGMCQGYRWGVWFCLSQ